MRAPFGASFVLGSLLVPAGACSSPPEQSSSGEEDLKCHCNEIEAYMAGELVGSASFGDLDLNLNKDNALTLAIDPSGIPQSDDGGGEGGEAGDDGGGV